MILILGECRGVYVDATALYAERYSNRRHPSNVTIRDLTRRARAGQLRRERRHHEYEENDNRVVTVLALIHLRLDPHADTGALTPSADWVKCCFY